MPYNTPDFYKIPRLIFAGRRLTSAMINENNLTFYYPFQRKSTQLRAFSFSLSSFDNFRLRLYSRYYASRLK